MFRVMVHDKKNEAEVPSSGTSQVLLSLVCDHECLNVCLGTAVNGSPYIYILYINIKLNPHQLNLNCV